MNGDYTRIRNINNILRRNRRILEQVCGEGRRLTRVSQSTLAGYGFNFRYVTHVEDDRKGSRFSYCYDYGYCVQDNGFITVRYSEPLL